MYDKSVALGSRLHYPITITKLLKAPGDNIRRQESIIEYKFAWRRKITDQDTGEDRWTDEVTYTEFDSPAEGTLKGWRIKEGQEIYADMHAMTIEEACSHEVQIQGLCSLCGQDMTETNWASEGRETDRAMINMTHDQTGLMVSENVATKAEHDAQKRLLKQRKLSLVVDLDQTIIHACIEPTIGEWQRDPENPNHGAVKDVRSFQLDDGPSRGPASGCTYYIKLRPGLKEFLEEVAEKYELHVYTMGTRAYALNIAKIVDPDSRLFGNRVISRDENGSITAKSLQRLFPVSTNMVVIIDDRADVWPMNRPNLIKVVPYDFFKGIGDINSSFLPKRTDIVPAKTNGTPKVAPKPADAAITEGAKPSPMDELAKMSEADEKALKSQTEEQEKTLEKQLTDRPLLHMQEKLDKEEEEQSAEEASPGHHRQNLLVDDDEELVALQDHLNDLHTSFYDTYDQKRKSRPESHSQHRCKSVSDGVDLSMVPDVGDILDELKQNVLEGLVIALSGLVPIGIKVEESDIGVQAQSFGAQVLDVVSKRVTHLVVSSERPRTKKVQQAAKIPSIKIVNQNWLTDCLSQWRRLDEGPYYINIIESDRAPIEDVSEPVSEFEEDDVKDLKDLDWEAADKEMEEFLGSDDDLDSDADTAMVSEAESQMDGGSLTKKRKKTEVNTDGESETESVLAKKQRVARNRPGSALRSAQAANGDDDEESSLPTPGPTTGDEDQSQQAQDDFEDDLERELLAELEAAEA